MTARILTVTLLIALAALALRTRAAERPKSEPAKETDVKEPTSPMLTFVQLTDSHMTADGMRTGKTGRGNLADKLTRAVKEINELKPDFVVVTGDLVEVGTVGEYETFRRLMSKLTMPWHAVPGNHETLEGT